MVLFGCRKFSHPISGNVHITSHGFNQADTNSLIWQLIQEVTPQRSRTWPSHMFWALKVSRDRTFSITLGSEREGKRGEQIIHSSTTAQVIHTGYNQKKERDKSHKYIQFNQWQEYPYMTWRNRKEWSKRFRITTANNSKLKKVNIKVQ